MPRTVLGSRILTKNNEQHGNKNGKAKTDIDFYRIIT